MNRGPTLPISFIDVLALMLLVLFLLPMKPDVAASDDSNAGMVVVEIHWPETSLADVDLWIQCPDDVPVGYSRLRGRNCSLFRDDLGGDPTTPYRYEIAASRSILDGEYIVNLHLYGDRAAEAPIPVAVHVWFRTPLGGKVTVYTGTTVLPAKGAEVTVVRWQMRNSAFLPESVHYTTKLLRAAGIPSQ